jgi:hypothetical protein
MKHPRGGRTAAASQQERIKYRTVTCSQTAAFRIKTKYRRLTARMHAMRCSFLDMGIIPLRSIR